MKFNTLLFCTLDFVINLFKNRSQIINDNYFDSVLIPWNALKWESIIRDRIKLFQTTQDVINHKFIIFCLVLSLCCACLMQKKNVVNDLKIIFNNKRLWKGIKYGSVFVGFRRKNERRHIWAWASIIIPRALFS